MARVSAPDSHHHVALVVLLHSSTIWGPFLLPMLVSAGKRGRDPTIRHHCRAALRFQVLVYLIGAPLVFCVGGLFVSTASFVTVLVGVTFIVGSSAVALRAAYLAGRGAGRPYALRHGGRPSR